MPLVRKASSSFAERHLVLGIYPLENHRKTIGKWWFNGGLMGFNQQNGDFDGYTLW